MMRVVLLAVLCGALSLLQPAEVRMNLEQLRAFVSSSRKLGHSDKQIADYLKNIKLTERLDSARWKIWARDRKRPTCCDVWSKPVRACRRCAASPAACSTADSSA